MIDWYEALPAHPRGRALETFTGYLTRLGEANGIVTMTRLASLVFPRTQRQVVYAMEDLLPLSLGHLPQATNHPASDLVAMTLYHVARKFGRSTSPVWLSRFLAGMLSPTFRYCPACLAEKRYRSLVWRFVSVHGCAEHGCRFLDRCGHCHATIPFFASPLRVAGCSTCGGDLRGCHAPRLTDLDVLRSRHAEMDAAALLTPHPCEQTDRPASLVGGALIAVRQGRGLERAEVARRLDISELAVRALEVPYTNDKAVTSTFTSEAPVRVYRAAPLARYMAYLRALDVDMPSILAHIDAIDDHGAAHGSG